MCLFNNISAALLIGPVWSSRLGIGEMLMEKCAFENVNVGTEVQELNKTDATFSSQYGEMLKQGELLPGNVVAKLIKRQVQSVITKGKKACFSDLSTEGQLRTFVETMGIERMRGVLGIFFECPEVVCRERGLRKYSADYVTRRMTAHALHINALRTTLTDEVDMVIHVDATKSREEIWDQIQDQLSAVAA